MTAGVLHRLVPDRSSSGAGTIHVTRWCCSNCGTSWRGLPALSERSVSDGCTGAGAAS